MNPPDLADVLAEVNRLRAQRGMTPLEEMPKAGLGTPLYSCPLAVALDASVGFVIWRAKGSDCYRDLPPTLASFREGFDCGAYPELQA